MKFLSAFAAVALAASASAQPSAKGPMQLWRLDCGDFVMKRYGAWFSDTFQYPVLGGTHRTGVFLSGRLNALLIGVSSFALRQPSFAPIRAATDMWRRNDSI